MKEQKIDLFIYLIYSITLLGVIADVIFWSVPYLRTILWVTDNSSMVWITNQILKGKDFWIGSGGLYYRLGYVIMCAAIAYSIKSKSMIISNKNQPFIISMIGLIALFSYKIFLYPNSNPLLSVIGWGVALAGLLFIPAGFIGIKSSINFNLEDELPKLNQNKKLILSDYSINWKTKDGYVNILNPFRGINIVGGPGSGKSYTLIEEIIEQMVKKGFTMMIYDFKFPSLGRYAYNAWVRNKHQKYFVNRVNPVTGEMEKIETEQPKFYCINFKDVRYSHRCNPLHPKILDNKAKSDEAAMTVLYNINRDWIKKSSDFFVSSAVSYLASIIWYLRNYQVRTGVEICTLPHAIAFSMQPIDRVVELLVSDFEASYGANPIKEAYEKGAMEQLAGVVASLQNSIGKLGIKEMFWVMTGNDFTLDINNPEDPKIVILGNNDTLKKVFAPGLSLYAAMIAGEINQQNRLPSGFVCDEFPTIFIPGIDNLPNTGRSNKVATVVAMQDFGQLDRDYGKEEARVLKAGLGSIFIGEVADQETAKYASELLGKQWIKKTSLTLNTGSTSQSINKSQEQLLSPSKIMQQNQGEFVGKTSDVREFNPTWIDQLIGRKKPSTNEDMKLFSSKFLVDNVKPKNPHDIPIITDFGTEENMNYVLDQHFIEVNELIKKTVDYQFWFLTIRKYMRNHGDLSKTLIDWEQRGTDQNEIDNRISSVAQYFEDYIRKNPKAELRDKGKFWALEMGLEDLIPQPLDV